MTRFTFALLAAAALRALAGEVDLLAQEPMPPYAGPFDPLHNPEAYGYPSAIEYTDPETAKQLRELGAVDSQIQELLPRYGTASDDSARARIRASLATAVERQFTIRQVIRQRELQRIEAELKRLQTVHEQRNAQSSKIINNRVEHLITETVGLGWGETSDISYGGDPEAYRPYGGKPEADRRYGWGMAADTSPPAEVSPSGESNFAPSTDSPFPGAAGQSSPELGAPVEPSVEP